MAYAATGISSCHEPISADEVLSRLRLGLYVMIREGSIRRDLEAISKIRDFGIDFRRLILVTDGVSPADLLQKGYMEFVVQKAIDCGFDACYGHSDGHLERGGAFRPGCPCRRHCAGKTRRYADHSGPGYDYPRGRDQPGKGCGGKRTGACAHPAPCIFKAKPCQRPYPGALEAR